MPRCFPCDVDLVPHEHEGRTLHACPSCAGLFITQAALGAVARDSQSPRTPAEHEEAVAAATGRLDDDSPIAVRRCPSCAKVMRRFVYAFSSGVVVDSCDSHGTWLDPGELQRIEAWSEATGHGAQTVADPAAASSAPAAAPRVIEPGGDQRGQMLAGYMIGGVEGMLAVGAVGWLASSIAGRGRRRTEIGVQIAAARARAEAGAAPTAADGGIVATATVRIGASSDEVWPRLARIDSYASWITGIASAAIESGTGSGRVQVLDLVNAHRIQQQVVALHAGRSITWRDQAEWLHGLEVPTWNDGAWTTLTVAAAGPGACDVTWTATFRAADDIQRQRIAEREPALRAWMEGSLATLAAAFEGRAAAA
jgi:Zn-finger nucleic acid-binding protein